MLTCSQAFCRELRGHHIWGALKNGSDHPVLLCSSCHSLLFYNERQRPWERNNYPGQGREASCTDSVPACIVLIHWESSPLTSVPMHCTASKCHSVCVMVVVETVCFEFLNAAIFVLRKHDQVDNYFTAEGWLSRHGTFHFTKSISVLSKPSKNHNNYPFAYLFIFLTHKFAIIPSHTWMFSHLSSI